MKTALVWRRLGLALAFSIGTLGLAQIAVAQDVDVTYNPTTGALTVNPNGNQLVSILVGGPQATSVDRWLDGTDQDGITGWVQTYFSGMEQWIGAGSAVSGDFVSPANQSYQIATYATGLTAADFSGAEIGAQDPANPGVGGLVFTVDVNIGGTPTLACDFNGDGLCNVADINELTRVGNLATGVNSGDAGYDAKYDLTNDTVINGDDISSWLAGAATENGWAEPYLLGDTNLDGTVNFDDFVNLNNNWQQSTLPGGDPVAWNFGDLNGDNFVDFGDFVSLNNNWQQSISSAASFAAVPEPAGLALCSLALLGLAFRRRK